MTDLHSGAHLAANRFALHRHSCSLFLTSRRLHTRCGRDWSSDVCSSDLPNTTAPGPLSRRLRFESPAHITGHYRFDSVATTIRAIPNGGTAHPPRRGSTAALPLAVGRDRKSVV